MSKNNKRVRTLFLCLLFSFSALTAEANEPKEHQSKEQSPSSNYQPRNTWKPHFEWAGHFQSQQSVFSEVNIGIGFLYFDDIKANLGNLPASQFTSSGSVPQKRDLSYSKTPLFEYIVGYRFNQWLKLAISYQNQSNIYVQTRQLPTTSGTVDNTRIQFNSDLQLNMIAAKFHFELPWPLLIKKLAMTPFLAGGPAVSWQSWSNINNRIFQTPNNVFIGTDVPYRQKTVASVGALADFGLRLHKAMTNNSFSMTLGCKYIYWGQTRNLGKLNQQANFKRGLIGPFRIKSLYSFSPYIGLNWDFPVTENATIAGRNTAVDQMFFISPKHVYTMPAVTADVNIGPSFLYFSKLRGDLAGQPDSLFFGTGSTIPLDRRLSYTKSPLIECVLGYRINRWLEMGLSYLYQNETMLISRWLPARGNTAFQDAKVQFKSYLNLNGFMAKFTADLISGVIRSMAFTPFISVGVGPTWQSWTDVKVERTFVINGNYLNNFLYLRDAIIANASWMADAGIKWRNASPDFLFSFIMGCKYCQWGQVRNIGKIGKQNGLSMGLVRPVTSKMMYSFTPYLGMLWDFPVSYTYRINSKSVYTWKPFIAKAKDLQNRFSLLTQVNIGPGILFFDKIRGNFGGSPGQFFTQNGSSPFKGHLRYNITPVYEFILGYRFLQWFKAAISYQMQKSLFFSTEPIPAIGAVTNGGAPINGAKNQFRAHLTLDSFLVKLLFELPFPLVFKGYALSPYIGASNGVGWQSWKNMRVNRIFNVENTVGLNSFNQNIRQKIIANYVWMVEGGFRVRNASPNFPFSGVFGCKYIQWGQARNIGELSQGANNFKTGLLSPFRIRVLGSITPYVGLQWNF